jgi:hypothetical protein
MESLKPTWATYIDLVSKNKKDADTHPLPVAQNWHSCSQILFSLKEIRYYNEVFSPIPSPASDRYQKQPPVMIQYASIIQGQFLMVPNFADRCVTGAQNSVFICQVQPLAPLRQETSNSGGQREDI